MFFSEADVVALAKERRALMKPARKGTPEYTTWQAMKTRCLNPNFPAYRYYGGRGITICDEWINSFEEFLADMGPRPAGTTLDRVNNDGNYEPANCRWASAEVQRTNQRSTDRRSTTCRQGHAWTPENTVLYGDGYRTCRTCRDARMKR